MTTPKIKIGLVCVALNGERVDIAQSLLFESQRSLLGSDIELVNPESQCTINGDALWEQTKQCCDKGACTIIYLIGTWVMANHIVDTVRNINIPIGIWGVPNAESFSSVGASVVHGALVEMGINHRLFYGQPDELKLINKLSSFAKACKMKRVLSSARMGLIGGRSINAYPTTADPMQIKKIFGTEIEHIDQMEVLDQAKCADGQRVSELCHELRNSFCIDSRLTDSMLEKSVRVSIGLEKVVEKYDFDFCSIKCLGEFIDTYTSCCLAVALMNEKGIITGCQCSINATLSMYLLNQLTNCPVFFGDVNCIDVNSSIARVINCGSIPPSLANDRGKVQLAPQYEYMGAGGGACTLFCCRAGRVTFGTLGRRNGKYVMNIASGEALEKPISELKKVRDWAQGFVKLDGDPELFYHNILSNHSVFGYGDHREELLEFCELMGLAAEENYLN